MFERFLKWTLILLVVAHVVVIGGYFARTWRAVYKQRTIPVEAREFTIARGASLNDTLERLHQMELSPSPLMVRLIMVWNDHQVVVKTGHYQLPEKASTWELLWLFEEGRVELHKITIPEGLDKWQTAELLGESQWGDASEFAALIEDPSLIAEVDPKAPDLEGYLFPETYFFPKDATPKEVVGTMVRHFINRTEDLRPRLAERGFTVREWLAMASMIERESSIEEERTTISGVFANRIKTGMLLQCDPTIIYSLKREGLYKGKIYKSQIRYDSPYNTYVYKGLPPGPIASPGFSSLKAALEPDETPYYYFVARDDGSHQFSENLRDHNRAVRKYQR